jgi:adenylate cyclase
MINGTILIVDDDEDVRFLLAAMLESDGYAALQTNSAERAMEIASANRIDAFLLDIAMPGTSGIELCRMIRKLPAYKGTPILFVTGAADNLAEAFACGGDDFLNKPIDRLALQTRLKVQLQRAEHGGRLSRTLSMLDRYLSKRTREVVESAARTGVLPSPEQREVVILFTDIRGFTAMSEEMEPTRLFKLISNELSMQVHLVHEHGGYVDKFGGDGLMAVFDGDDKEVRSCVCALQIMAGVRESMAEDQEIQQLGIGIHMGPVVIGNLGSSEHFDYSVIGNAVNLAARLCGYAGPRSIIVSKKIRDAAAGNSRLHFDSERQVPIRGLKEEVTIYTLSPGS